MENMAVNRSQEEVDQLQRSVEKQKTDNSLPAQSVWQRGSGVAVVTGQITTGSFYIGEDDENMEVEYKETVDNLMGPEKDDAAMVLSLEECKELWKPWSKALIIKLIGKTITYNFLCKRLTELWKHKGRIDVTDLEHGFFVVRFTRKEDYEAALGNGPWIIMGQYLAVQKWKPFFQPEHKKITTTMAWIRFSSLSLEMFKRPLLMKLGSLIGRAIKIDHTTSTSTRGKFVRVCVELDLDQPLKSSVVINGRRFKVEYEGLQQICFNCGTFGHNKEYCQELLPDMDPKTAEIVVAKEVQRPSGPTSESPYGPWMIASSRRGWNSTKNGKINAPQEGNRREVRVDKTPTVAAGSRFDVLDNTEEMNLEVPESVRELREAVKGVESHGEAPSIKEIHKDQQSKSAPSPSNATSGNSGVRQRVKNSKQKNTTTQSGSEFGRKRDQPVSLSAQGQHMKRTTGARSKTVNINALSDVFNQPRAPTLGHTHGQVVIVNKRGHGDLIGDNVKANPPDKSTDVAQTHVQEESTHLNPLYENEPTSSTQLELTPLSK